MKVNEPDQDGKSSFMNNLLPVQLHSCECSLNISYLVCHWLDLTDNILIIIRGFGKE